MGRDISIMILTASLLIGMIGGSLQISPLSHTAIPAYSTESFWTSGSPLPTPREVPAGVLVDEKIYVVGGVAGKEFEPTDIMEVYDPKEDSWISSSPLLLPLHHPGSASHDGKLYVLGGWPKKDEKNPTNKLFIYDVMTSKWKEAAPMPTARAALTAAFIDGKLYAIGGKDKKELNVNEMYDPETDRWTVKEPMPTARHHLASSVVDGKLYAIGGRQDDDDGTYFSVAANEIYDPNKDSWATLEPMPTLRSSLVSAAISGRIYVCGGEERNLVSNVTEKYDTETNKWSTEPPMPTARHGYIAGAFQDKIYVIGGGVMPGSSVSGVNEIFHVPIEHQK